MEENPTEFLTFLFVNSGPSLRQWAQAYYETGFDLISYVPPREHRHGRTRIEDWPTVEEMVKSGKRAVTFLSRGAREWRVPYLLNEFDYMFEVRDLTSHRSIDEGDQTDKAATQTDFSNYHPSPSFPCVPNRPHNRFPPTAPIPNRLTFVNHFLYGKLFGFPYPYAQAANHTNGPGFGAGELGEHAARCRTLYGRRPNFFLVDFFNEGDVWKVEAGMNRK